MFSLLEKKTQHAEGKTVPWLSVEKEDIIMRVDKTLEPLPHPYIAAPLPTSDDQRPDPGLRPVLWLRV